MSRIRTIKPEFQESESMGRVSREARLMFILLWTYADDHGRARAAERMLASRLFPFDDDAQDLIGGWLRELEKEGCIVRYSFRGTAYLQVTNWTKHQRVDKPSPSRLPSHEDALSELALHIREEHKNIREVSVPDLVPSTLDLGEEPSQEEWLVNLDTGEIRTAGANQRPKFVALSGGRA